MAGAFNFPIIAPQIVKRGESVRIILGTIPASPAVIRGKLTGTILAGATGITLSGVIPADQNRVDFYYNGVYQNKDQWSISAGNAIAFSGWSTVADGVYEIVYIPDTTTLPLPPNPGSETIEIAIIDPSGRILPQQVVVKTGIGSVTYSAHYYFNFVFPSVGTFTIFAKVTTPPTPDVYIGIGVVHVPAWLDLIDTNISDIAKANTEISRLRTSITRTVTGA